MGWPAHSASAGGEDAYSATDKAGGVPAHLNFYVSPQLLGIRPTCNAITFRYDASRSCEFVEGT
jgi:hypothetical protein